MNIHQRCMPILLTAVMIGVGCSNAYAQTAVAGNGWNSPATNQSSPSHSAAPSGRAGYRSAPGQTGGSLYQQSVLGSEANAYGDSSANNSYPSAAMGAAINSTCSDAGIGAASGGASGDASCWSENAGWQTGYGSATPAISVGVATAAPSAWFASVNGMFMSRDAGHHHRFSFGTGNLALQLVDVPDANMDLTGGFETRIGRTFNCGQNAIEVSYWRLFPGTGESTVYGSQVSGDLNAILNYNQLNYNGNTADAFSDNGVAHRVRRDMDFQNAEINLVRYSQKPCSNWSFEWRTGPQYFRFSEDLEFAADNADTNFTGAANELYHTVDVENNLIGWRLAGSGTRQITRRLSTKFSVGGGLFANYIDHHSRIGGSAGDAVINNGPFVNRAYNVQSNTTSVAFLGQIDGRVNYQIGCRWNVYAGYRLMAISGVALPADQIYHDLRGINDVEEIESDGALMLHGGYAGLECCF